MMVRQFRAFGIPEDWKAAADLDTGVRVWQSDVELIVSGYDYSTDPPSIEARTLVLHRPRLALVPDAVVREVAAGIPNSRLVLFDGENQYPWFGDADEIADAVEGFLGEAAESADAASASGFQTILFTDLEASTPLTQRLGDEGAQEILRGHNATVRGALDEHGGREVKHTGDGIMASFPSAVAAVTAALQIQQGLAGGEVRVRVGLKAGEPIAEDDDLFGLSVIKAARIVDRAEPGQVLVSNVVMELCEGKTFEFTSLGAVSLRGFDETVTLFEVTA